MKKVLITGMSGRIGKLLSCHLDGLGIYELSSLDIHPVESPDHFRADINDLEAIKPAFEAKEMVIHLAAHQTDENWDKHISTNIIGTYNVYEAARLAGVKRVVFASSGSTIEGFQRVAPYDAIASGRYQDVPQNWTSLTHNMVRPEGIYGAAKVLGEALGRHFSDTYGMSVLCIRLGVVPADNRPGQPQDYATYLSHRDVVQVVRRCLEAPDDLLYDIFLATSNNRWGFRDLEHARDVLGYVPQDSADTFLSA